MMPYRKPTKKKKIARKGGGYWGSERGLHRQDSHPQGLHPQGLHPQALHRQPKMRTPEHPYILIPVPLGAPNSKLCSGCDRNIRHADYPDRLDGLHSRCDDCMYMQNTLGYCGIVTQEGPPLQRRVYLGRDPRNGFDLVSRVEVATA